MLRRNSSRQKQRRPLGRSKSTNSIFRDTATNFVSIDAFVAERDAHIAATLSYDRAQTQGRHSCDMPARSRGPGNCGLGRSNSVASEIASSRSSITKDRHESSPGHRGLQRQQSVRFAGPNAKPRRPLAARANQALLATTNSKPNDLQYSATGRTQVSSLGYGSQLSDNNAAQSLRCVGQLPQVSLAADGHMQPIPPALGRLHKSRSMFISSIPSASEFDISEEPTERLREWLAMPGHDFEDKENGAGRGFGAQGLRAPKSMSFLQGHSAHAHSRTSSCADKDLSAPLAPDRLSCRSGSRHLKSHSSMLFRSKHRRREASVGLPKSLRNSSNNSAALSSTFSGNTTPVVKQSGLRVTARKVSRTLKSKFMRLFGRPRSANDMMGDAIRLNRSFDCDKDSCHRVDGAAAHEEASMCRVASQVPSLHAVPSKQQLRSRQGSLENIHGDQNLMSDDKSRVTSWSNSSANTVLSQSTIADWERQRLSVIKESSMHVPASTVPRHNDPSPGPSAPRTAPSTVHTVNSQRVYSALVKRLNEKRQKEGETDNREMEETPRFRPACRSNVERGGAQGWSPPTIRHVQSDDDVFQDKIDTPSAQETIESPAESALRGKKRLDSQRSASYKAYPDPTAGDGMGLSPYRFGQKPDAVPSGSLGHSSAFFASPTCHLFRAASPFRRALQETMKEKQEGEHMHALDTRYLSTLSALSLPTRRPSTAGSERDIRMTYAESVYSCATEDARQCQLREDKSVADGGPSPRASHRCGDATIFVDPPACTPAPKHSRDVSSASSVEWKTWLSANASKLETPSTTLNTDNREASHTLPAFGHIREAAEIESPGDAKKSESLSPGLSEKVTPIMTLVDGGCHASSLAKSKMMREARAKTSLAVDENSQPATGELGKDPCSNGPPKLPSRSNLRAIPSLPNVQAGRGGRNGCLEVALPRMRSLGTVANVSPLTREDQLKRRPRARLEQAGSSPAKESPGLTAAVEKQFGKAKTDCAARGHVWNPEQNARTPSIEDGKPPEAARSGSDRDAEVMGSKRMVDLFLSSRRKRIKGSKTGTESEEESTSAVFL